MKKIKIIVAGLAFLQFIACTKKIDEAYQSPNAPVRVPVEKLLPQIVSAMAGNYAGHGTMNDTRYVGAYIQNWHFYLANSNFDAMGYTNSAADVAQSTWRMHYYDIGQNNQKMMLWAAEEKKWDYVGVGKAIEAWSWMVLTDYYGDVILEQAFNQNLLTFQYDTQDEVYEKIKNLCFESLDNLSKTGDGVSAANLAVGDAYFFNGDAGKWKKFVYGILARYHNHFSNKSVYKADSAIYYADRAIVTVDEMASVKFAATNLSATNNFFGPRRGNFVGTGVTAPTAVRQGAYIANLLTGANTAFTGVNDPRAWYLLRGNGNGTIKGVSPSAGQAALAAADRPENFWGVAQATASNTAPTSDVNCRFIFTNSAPFPIMTPAEMKFIKAEAAYKLGDKTAALQAYTEGISLHFDMLTTVYSANIPAARVITPAMKAAFLANTAVVPASSADLTLSKIMLQKYIAMFGHGVLETWMDLRRYHYTDTDNGSQVYTGFQLPTLFANNLGEPVYRYYPRFNSEYVWNIKELERIGATTTNYHTKKLWITEP